MWKGTLPCLLLAVQEQALILEEALMPNFLTADDNLSF